jgi:hypothetical protein
MDGGESGMGVCLKTERTISWQQYCILREVGCGIRSRPAPSPSESEITNKILRMVESDEWQKEHDATIAAQAREKLITAFSHALQKKTFFNGTTWCVSNSDIDEVFESLRTGGERR